MTDGSIVCSLVLASSNLIASISQHAKRGVKRRHPNIHQARITFASF